MYGAGRAGRLSFAYGRGRVTRAQTDLACLSFFFLFCFPRCTDVVVPNDDHVRLKYIFVYATAAAPLQQRGDRCVRADAHLAPEA